MREGRGELLEDEGFEFGEEGGARADEGMEVGEGVAVEECLFVFGGEEEDADCVFREVVLPVLQ
jgi:hypothetical protein